MKPQPSHLYIDREGVWYAEGQKVTHEKIFKLFCDSLVRDNEGYKIVIDYMENPVIVEDAPVSVRSLFVENTSDGTDVVWLTLSDGGLKKLDPSTVFATSPEAIYCAIDDERGFTARFAKHALVQLSALLTQKDSDTFTLELNEQLFEFSIKESA